MGIYDGAGENVGEGELFFIHREYAKRLRI